MCSKIILSSEVTMDNYGENVPYSRPKIIDMKYENYSS